MIKFPAIGQQADNTLLYRRSYTIYLDTISPHPSTNWTCSFSDLFVFLLPNFRFCGWLCCICSVRLFCVDDFNRFLNFVLLTDFYFPMNFIEDDIFAVLMFFLCVSVLYMNLLQDEKLTENKWNARKQTLTWCISSYFVWRKEHKLLRAKNLYRSVLPWRSGYFLSHWVCELQVLYIKVRGFIWKGAWVWCFLDSIFFKVFLSLVFR